MKVSILRYKNKEMGVRVEYKNIVRDIQWEYCCKYGYEQRIRRNKEYKAISMYDKGKKIVTKWEDENNKSIRAASEAEAKALISKIKRCEILQNSIRHEVYIDEYGGAVLRGIKVKQNAYGEVEEVLVNMKVYAKNERGVVECNVIDVPNETYRVLSKQIKIGVYKDAGFCIDIENYKKENILHMTVNGIEMDIMDKNIGKMVIGVNNDNESIREFLDSMMNNYYIIDSNKTQ